MAAEKPDPPAAHDPPIGVNRRIGDVHLLGLGLPKQGCGKLLSSPAARSTLEYVPLERMT